MSREGAKAKYLLVGGGTGGHITPLLAVAHELKKLQGEAEIVSAIERGNKFAHLVTDNPDISKVYFIRAGKFRRYHGESWLRRLTDFKTNLLNVRDSLYTFVGIFQAIRLLGKVKPDAIFIKGGFVGVPLGIAARLRRIPFITHDSDTVPGLANRIVGRWAAIHATGMPAEFYNYPEDRTHFVGIPVSSEFNPVTAEDKIKFRREIGLPAEAKTLLITGGSLGAQRLNKLVAGVITDVIRNDPELYVIHQTGKTGSRALSTNYERIITKEFLPDLYKYSGAADVIIARAGATSIAEFSIQGKACILVPHAQLTGGHQAKNAEELSKVSAAIVFSEKEIESDETVLTNKIMELLNDETYRQKLETNISNLAKPNAARKLAQLITELAHETV